MQIASKKNLCAHIPIELHQKVCEEKDKTGLKLDEYVELLLVEYFKLKERKNMSNIKTLAIQIDEDLFNRMKAYVDSVPHLSQRAFITELIIKALDEIENSEETNEGA